LLVVTVTLVVGCCLVITFYVRCVTFTFTLFTWLRFCTLLIYVLHWLHYTHTLRWLRYGWVLTLRFGYTRFTFYGFYTRYVWLRLRYVYTRLHTRLLVGYPHAHTFAHLRLRWLIPVCVYVYSWLVHVYARLRLLHVPSWFTLVSPGLVGYVHGCHTARFTVTHTRTRLRLRLRGYTAFTYVTGYTPRLTHTRSPRTVHTLVTFRFTHVGLRCPRLHYVGLRFTVTHTHTHGITFVYTVAVTHTRSHHTRTRCTHTRRRLPTHGFGLRLLRLRTVAYTRFGWFGYVTHGLRLRWFQVTVYGFPRRTAHTVYHAHTHTLGSRLPARTHCAVHVTVHAHTHHTGYGCTHRTVTVTPVTRFTVTAHGWLQLVTHAVGSPHAVGYARLRLRTVYTTVGLHTFTLPRWFTRLRWVRFPLQLPGCWTDSVTHITVGYTRIRIGYTHTGSVHTRTRYAHTVYHTVATQFTLHYWVGLRTRTRLVTHAHTPLRCRFTHAHTHARCTLRLRLVTPTTHVVGYITVGL